jgi:glycerol kinase
MIDRNDVLYVLTISGDLAPYYDSRFGAGAWAGLNSEAEYNISRAVEKALTGLIGDFTEAFDAVLDDLEDN